jgi:UDP-glucose 4-epimerase
VASSRRARRELGWTPRASSLEQMLTDAWAWKVTHPQGYADRLPAEAEKEPTTSGPERGIAASAATI